MSFINKIICPHCGLHCESIEDVVGVDGEYGNYFDTKVVYRCHRCNKEFQVETMTICKYETTKQ